ncbi:MAG: hypothetical protein KAR39_10585 [Thermoplasmata archaeon]|nr:hypothetical protein [Thermoplasmata archaeon]
MKSKLIGVILAAVVAIWGTLAIIPSVSAQEQGGHIWLTIEGSEYEANHTDPWINESWVYAVKYEANETVQYNLTVENRGEESVDAYVLFAIRGNTTGDDMEQVVIQGGAPGAMTFTLADFDRVDFNPFYLNVVSAGSHGVYPPSGNATWVTYPVGLLEGTESGNNVTTLLVEVTLGPDPSEIFVVHSDGYGLNSDGELNYWSPNGHDVTVMMEEDKGKGHGKGPKGDHGGGHGKKGDGGGQTPVEEPEIPGVIQDDPPVVVTEDPSSEDPSETPVVVTEDPPAQNPAETPDPTQSEQESPEVAGETTEDEGTPLAGNEGTVEELDDIMGADTENQIGCLNILVASAMVALLVSILFLALTRRKR